MIKRLSLLVLVVAATLNLTGCKSDYTQVSNGSDYCIIAMKDTGVLYYRGAYMMAPYYNENGHLCRWVDGKIVEIDDEKEVENDGNKQR